MCPKWCARRSSTIGFCCSDSGFDCHTCGVITSIHEQSPDIAMGVNASQEARAGGDDIDQVGAGDQGMMFGYACQETPELMPMPIVLAHGLVKRLAAVRKDGTLPYLRPDGKSQVTVEYHHGRPARVDTGCWRAASPDVATEKLRQDCRGGDPHAIPAHLLDVAPALSSRPQGAFWVAPHGRFGLTGRRSSSDLRRHGAHGGGGSQAKTPPGDRSGFLCHALGGQEHRGRRLAERCQLQIAYVIGVAHPSRSPSRPLHRQVSDERLGEMEPGVRTCARRPSSVTQPARPIYQPTRPTAFRTHRHRCALEALDRVEALREGRRHLGHALSEACLGSPLAVG